jgi:hypothetical protein
MAVGVVGGRQPCGMRHDTSRPGASRDLIGLARAKPE